MLDINVYSLKQKDKEIYLLEELKKLITYHYDNCFEYKKIIDCLKNNVFDKLIDLPYLPVSLFKEFDLLSIKKENVFKTLTSSGTTGQKVSKIYLDKESASIQTKCLYDIMSNVLCKKRLPMIIVDDYSILKNKFLSARGAGILGMMPFGRDHLFVLKDNQLQEKEFFEFIDKYKSQKILLFGFTFMVWKYFFQKIKDKNIDLSNITIIHSGGWKKLISESVDNFEFKYQLKKYLNIDYVYNFYGMVEQLGSVYLEGDDGYLHPPYYSDVIIRDLNTWEECPVGKPGVIQVISILPKSYPGHSILTEDLGVINSIDNNTKLGKAFNVLGRIPKAEIRGCSDTYAYSR